MEVPSGPAGAPVPPPSTPRAVVAYLKGVRGLVSQANDSRQKWIRQVGMLMREDGPEAAVQAGTVGNEQVRLFKSIRAALEEITPPPVCDACHVALTSWLDKHIAACDVMVEVGSTGELARLRSTQGLLAEARVDLQRFNTDCDQLIAMLRRRAESAKARRSKRAAVRWPFGHPKAGAPAEAT